MGIHTTTACQCKTCIRHQMQEINRRISVLNRKPMDMSRFKLRAPVQTQAVVAAAVEHGQPEQEQQPLPAVAVVADQRPGWRQDPPPAWTYNRGWWDEDAYQAELAERHRAQDRIKKQQEQEAQQHAYGYRMLLR